MGLPILLHRLRQFIIKRIVNRIFVDDPDVSAELVRQGAAWVYRKHAKDQNLYKLEDEARADKRRLWGLLEAQRVPPWEWRRR